MTDIIKKKSIQAAEKKPETLSQELQDLLHPNITGLIIVDVQKGYFSAPNSPLAQLTGASTTHLEKAAYKINDFIENSRKYNLASIVFARMEENPEVMSSNFAAKMRRRGTPALTKKGEESYEYFVVSPQESDKEIEKILYSSFEGTDLHEHLQEKGIKTVIIIGGYGSVCVDATAQSAANKGYNVFIPHDLVADLDTPENGSETDELSAFMHRFRKIYGETPSSHAILSTWENTSQT